MSMIPTRDVVELQEALSWLRPELQAAFEHGKPEPQGLRPLLAAYDSLTERMERALWWLGANHETATLEQARQYAMAELQDLDAGQDQRRPNARQALGHAQWGKAWWQTRPT